METEKLSKFLDDVIEGAYRSGCFQKESVQQVLIMAQMIKEKIIEADKLSAENLDQKVKFEILESENEKLKKWFNDLGIDLEELNKKIDVNEIEVYQTKEQELTPETIIEEKLFGSNGTNNLQKNKSTKILQK